MITWSVNEALSDAELQELFTTNYKRPNTVPFHQILEHCLLWVSARQDGQLVAFANVIWDGLYHALIVDRVGLDAVSPGLKHEAALKVVEALRERHPTVSKVHIECDEEEIPLLAPLGFERRTYGRLLW
jgi:hypothetical protein